MNTLNSTIFTLVQDLVLTEGSSPYLLTLPEVIKTDHKKPVIKESNVLVIDATKEVFLEKIFSPSVFMSTVVKAIYVEVGGIVHCLDGLCLYDNDFTRADSVVYGSLVMGVDEGFLTINNQVYVLHCHITSASFSWDQSIEPFTMDSVEITMDESEGVDDSDTFTAKLVGYELAVIATNDK